MTTLHETATATGTPTEAPSTPGQPRYASLTARPGTRSIVRSTWTAPSGGGLPPSTLTVGAVPADPIVHLCVSATDGEGSVKGLLHATMDRTTPLPTWGRFANLCTSAAPAFPKTVVDEAVAEVGGDLVVVAIVTVDGVGTLRFAERAAATGTWTTAAPLPVPSIGPVAAVAATGIGADLHVCAVTTARKLYHAIRLGTEEGGTPAGTWKPFTELVVPGTVPDAVDVAIAASGAELHVVALTGASTMHYDVRRPDGSWFGWTTVPALTAGDAIQIAATVGCGRLYVGAVTAHKTVYVAGRQLDTGEWLHELEFVHWIDVFRELPGLSAATDLSMAATGNELFLFVVAPNPAQDDA